MMVKTINKAVFGVDWGKKAYRISHEYDRQYYFGERRNYNLSTKCLPEW